jgi:hypothetical protein
VVKIAFLSATALVLSTLACNSQTSYVSGRPSIDCQNIRNSVALILCSGPEAAQADWQVNSATWALYFTMNEARRRDLDRDQQTWRQSLDQRCALPRLLTQEEKAGQVMAQMMGRIILGQDVPLPGQRPLTRAHVKCVLDAYHSRAALLRSNLAGDALAEALLSPEQHAEIQGALADKGFLRSEQVGAGTHDGEFGPITRKAIREFQQSLGKSPSGFLTDEERTALLERPGEREAREARAAAEAKAKQDALAAKAAAEEKAREDARIAAERRAAQAAAEAKAKKDAEIARLEAEAEAAKRWRLKIEEAQTKGVQYAEKAEFKWSLSEVDNPMTDDKDYTVTSGQTNGKGAIARIEGTCRRPGQVTFIATLGDAESNTSLGLPGSGTGYVPGNKRINDEPVFPVRFATQTFRNEILI